MVAGSGVENDMTNMKRWVLGWVVVSIIACGQPARSDDPREAARELRRTPVVKVVEQTRESVVNISTTQLIKTRRPSRFGFFFDDIFAYPKTMNGSGFVIHEDGYIVTNDHVVARSADHRVRFADGREYEAMLISSDPTHDLAVLKIDPQEPLRPLRLGRSDDLMVGEDAIVIGNPFGLENTVTRGVISALHRRLEFSQDVVYDDLIQTDASINPGNSGGPLLNILGELIGINTAIRPDAENVGFAIPVDHLRRLLPVMLDITHLKRVELGMYVSGDRAEVTSIESGSPADKAGFRLGDVISSVGGKPIGRDVDFYIAMLDHNAGEDVPMVVVRDGKTETHKVHLSAVATIDGKKLAWEKLGLRLEELSPKVARSFRLKRNAGLVIVEIDPRGPARRGVVHAGDLLVKVGRYRAWPAENIGILLQTVVRDDPIDITAFRFFNDNTVERIEQRLYAR